MIPDGKNSRAVNSTPSVHGLFLLGLLVILSPGCGAKGFASIRPGIEARGHYISGVPFFRQTGQDCGPAALAGILAFHGRPVDLETITASIYLPKLRGTLPMDLERFARNAGLTTASPDGTADALRSSVRSNVPVICLLDLGFGPYRQPHYVTVTGFDDENGLFVMHDGATPDRTMSYDAFEKKWARAGRWMIVIKP
jgi:ABC-type bacteriocin/lantibiotic exporter with double-glycine peptidase domain